MSTSLEKDLHSVYIDGELPDNFLVQYESIISSDAQAQKELAAMRAVHEILQSDAKSKTIDASFMEDSFNRLKLKMSYSKVARTNKKNSVALPLIRYAASFASAAAVFAAVFIPVHLRTITESKNTTVAAISILKENQFTPLFDKDVVVDGNIHPEKLHSALAVHQNGQGENITKNDFPQEQSSELSASVAQDRQTTSSDVEQKTIYATALATNGRREQFHFRDFPSLDPFEPDFSSSHIRISVPHFYEMHNNLTEMHNSHSMGD